MAKAYLGKISAIVTANTSDFNSKLNASANEVRTFARAMDSTLKSASSSAATSLKGIYTESQKVSRALQAVASQRLDFKGFDSKTFASLNAAVDQFKRIQQASVAVNEPLARAAQTIDRLSGSVQLAFEPAMASAQKSAEFLSAALARGGIVGERSFDRITQKALAAAAAADRLGEAAQIAGSGPRGTELAFAAPRVRDSLTASAAIRNQAANAPASVLEGGTIARDVQKLVTIDNLIQKRRAEVEAGIILNIDTTTARASLDALLAVSEKVRGRISTAITPASGGNRAADNEIALLQRREQAAKEFESRRASIAQNATDNEIALLQRREQAAKEVENQAAARAQRAADNEIALLQRREQAALQLERARLSEGQSSRIDPAANLEREARSRMGGDIPGGGGLLGGRLETGRQVDNVINRVAALRQQIDSLPDSVRSQFIPALQRATDEAAAIGSRGFGATAAQIRNAANEAERLEQGVSRAQRGQNFSSQFGGQGQGGVEFGLQEQSLRGYTAQLQILQQVLSGVSTTARGPALAAFDRLRAAISQAAANGTLDLRETRAEIERLTRDAAEASAGVARINPAGLGRRLKRAGDIGRGSFGNLGLGIQQAVFAFDDFFSVTGGLDQRIRAAGNNISQLGFVLGGTQGLIAGVAASITAQLIVAYIKWQNAGVGTEDRLKSLNDALSRQKSLVEDLAGAFKSVADEIANIGFSKPGADAAKFQQQLDDIRKKQREFNQERAAEVNPEVQTERGIIAAREAQLAKAENPGERVRLGLDIRNARARERAALDRQNARPGISSVEAAIRTNRSQLAVEEARIRENAERRAVSQGEQGDPGQTDREIEDARRKRQEKIDGLRTGRLVPADDLAEVIRTNIDNLNRDITENSNLFGSGGIANDERRSQIASLTDTLNLLEQGVVDSANRLEVETASAAVGAARQIGLAQAKVADAIEAGVPGAVGLQVQLDGLTQQLFDAQSELAAAQARARGENGTGADLGAATTARDEVARIQDAINQREFEIKAIEASRRALELFATAFEKVRQEAESNLQAAESARDQARGDDLEQGTAGSRQRLDRAESDVTRQNEARNRVRRETARAEEAARQDEEVRMREQLMGNIDARLASTGVLAPGQREEMIDLREFLRQQNESAVQGAVANDPGVQAARDASTVEERRRQSAERGRQASQTPAQKAGEELANTIRDIRTNFLAQQQEGGVAVRAGFEAFDETRRAAQDAMRQQAPAIFAMADAVQNAVLQGPSRAALQASDVTTMQGASELNRLIRGDDSAKNVDTVELQKQSKALEELVVIARANGAPPGVFN